MKIEKLPEHAKKQALNFIELLLNNYLISQEKESDRNIARQNCSDSVKNSLPLKKGV